MSIAPWRRFTLEQQRAAFLVDRPMLAAAGAGAGKTAVMAVRYCACLLDRDERGGPVMPDRILAVAFTREAAANLRARIDRTLRLVLERRRFPRFLVEEGLSESDLDQPAVEHLRRCLGDLPGAPIGTFDSLCLQLVGEHAAVLGRDPELRPQEDLAWKQCQEAAWSALEREDLAKPGGALARLVEVYGESATRTAVTRAAEQAAVMAEPTIAAAGGDPVAAVLALRAPQFDQLVDALAAAKQRPGDNKTLQTVRAINPRPPAKRDGLLSWLRQLEGLSVPGGSKDDDLKDAIREINDALDSPNQRDAKGGRPSADKRRQRGSLAALTAWDEAGEAACAARAAMIAGLAGRHLGHLDRAAVQAGLAGFSQVEAQCLRLLGDPAVRGRLGRRFRHLLLDEAQDLNRLQARIVERLQEGGATTGSARVFTVGDHRQSIFGFRHAAPEIFAGWEATIIARGGGAAELAENFRSHPALLVQVKAVFAQPILAEGFRAESIKPGKAAADFARGAQLSCWRVIATAAGAAFDLRRGAVDGSRAIAAQVAELVRRGIAAGRKPEEHAILLRSRSRMRLYAESLERAGIAYDTDFPGGLYDAQECHDCEAIIRLCLNRHDRDALAIAIGGPWGVADPQDRRLLVEALSLTPAAAWALASGRTAIGAVVEQVRPILAGEGVASALRRLASDERLTARYGRLPLARRRLANLARLAMEEEEAGTALDAVALIARLAERRRLGVDAAEAGGEGLGNRGVRLMTVHGAKGLEWPVVLLPEIGGRFNLRDLNGPALAETVADRLDIACMPGEDDHDGAGNGIIGLCAGLLADRRHRRLQAEESRLFYVACTRAMEELHCLVAGDLPDGPARDGSVACWGDWLMAPGFPWQDQAVALDAVTEPAPPAQATAALPELAHSTVGAIRVLSVSELLERDHAAVAAPAIATGYHDDLARALGTAVHQALERFGPGMSPEQAAAALAPLRSQVERGRLKRLQAHLADRELVPGYGRAAVRLHEQPVLTELSASPPTLLSGECDLLLKDAAGRWHLYDYKTGAAAAHPASRLQVQCYARMVRSHLDGELADAWLVDVEAAKLVAVPIAAADEAAAWRRIIELATTA